MSIILFYDLGNPHVLAKRTSKARPREKLQLLSSEFSDSIHYLAIRPHVLYESAKVILLLVCSLSIEIRAPLKGKIKVRAEKNSKTFFVHYFFWSGLARVMRKVAVGFFPFHYEIVVTALVQQLSVAFSLSP